MSGLGRIKHRVLVCGGRDFTDRDFVFTTLDNFSLNHEVVCLIAGGARGVDSLAKAWAVSRRIPTQIFPADWKKFGRAAGHLRNQQMLAEGKPTIVLAFPGGRGTENMVQRAEGSSVAVINIVR